MRALIFTTLMLSLFSGLLSGCPDPKTPLPEGPPPEYEPPRSYEPDKNIDTLAPEGEDELDSPPQPAPVEAQGETEAPETGAEESAGGGSPEAP